MEFKIKIKNFFIKTLLIMLALSFVIFGIINFFTGVGETNIAKINNDKISVNSFLSYVNNKRSQLFQSNLTNKDMNFVNSKDFVKLALRDFINETLITNEIEKFNLNMPKTILFDIVYNDPNFKNENGEFDLDLFNKFLSTNQVNEDIYLNFVGKYESRNNLSQLFTGSNLSSKSIIGDLLTDINKVYTVDILEINPENLKSDYKIPSSSEISDYYNKNNTEFTIPEEKIVSSIDVNLNEYKDNEEKLKEKLSELEDLTLSAKNIDQIANLYKVKKTTINCFENQKDKIPDDLSEDMLNSSAGIFSNLIYKDNNVYRIYYIEKVNPSRKLSLEEAMDKIKSIIIAKNKENNDVFALDKLVKQIRLNGIDSIAFRNNFNENKNVKIYKNDNTYSENFLNTIFELNNQNNVTKPIFDNKKNIYRIAYLKNIEVIKDTDVKYISNSNLDYNLNLSYRNSLGYLYKNYLLDSNKIVINTRLLETLD